MSPDALFEIATRSALVGWLALCLSPLAPRACQFFGGLVVPIGLSFGYTAIVLVYWSRASGGFDSLSSVMVLFDHPMIALAGWVHYLAFDLLIGAWQARTAQSEGIPHLVLLPCLALTLMFGPAGLVLFLSIRAARAYAAPVRHV